MPPGHGITKATGERLAEMSRELKHMRRRTRRRRRDRPKGVVGRDEFVSLQSANSPTTLTGTDATMGLGATSPVLPPWLSRNGSYEFTFSGDVVGKMVEFVGQLRFDRATPTGTNTAQVTLQVYDSGFGGFVTLWQQQDIYWPNDSAISDINVTPYVPYGPIEDGEQFRLQAKQTSGSDVVRYMGGLSDLRLNLRVSDATHYNLPLTS
jgi:hypothetical protein